MRVPAEHIDALAVDVGGRHVRLLLDATATIEHIHHLVRQVHTSKCRIGGTVRLGGGVSRLVQDFENLATRLEAAKEWRGYHNLYVL